MTPRTTSILSKSSRVKIEFDLGIEASVKLFRFDCAREMLNQLKKDIPYHSLIKVYSAEKIGEERKAS